MAGRMKGDDQSTSGTTFVTVADFEWDLEYGKPEYFEMEVFFTTNSSLSGVKFRLVSSESLPDTNFWASVDGGLTGIFSALSSVIGAVVVAGDHHVRIAGGYFPSDPAGSFELQFAQNAALGGTVTAKKCSWYNHWPELP